jgi:hypothetical protein
MDLKDDVLCGVPTWEEMRSAVIFRGISLGGLIDFASQSVCGSVRNLGRFAGLSEVPDALNVALCLVTNWAKYGESNALLGIRVSWLEDGGVRPVSGPDVGVLVDAEMHTEDLIEDDEDRWWIENRGPWSAVQSPDVRFPVIADVKDWSRSDVVRFGNNTVYSCQSDKYQINRMVSVLDFAGDAVNYSFDSTTGPLVLQISMTNNTAPFSYISWHSVLDKICKGKIQGDLGSVETANVQFAVRHDTFAGYGRFSEMGLFAGTSDF